MTPTTKKCRDANDMDETHRDALINIVRFALLSVVFIADPSHQAWALSALAIGDLSDKDAGTGIKTALERGAQIAIELLGKENGFWGNDSVRIPLPGWIQKKPNVRSNSWDAARTLMI